jgi:glucose-1-phosphate thymidylyltransferase
LQDTDNIPLLHFKFTTFLNKQLPAVDMAIDEKVDEKIVLEFIQNNMRGVILAGGKGTRLLPLTKVTNKHLVPVGNKPMIEYPLETLTLIGIKDILIVTGVEHMGQIADYLEDGSSYGLEFTYRVQKKAGGIAQALSLAEDFSRGKKLAVILGDNIFGYSFREEAMRFLTNDYGAMLFLKEVEDAQRFGVATIDKQRKQIISIEEKPEQPKSNLAVTGLYFYDSTVFDKIRQLKPSARGELEITDVNTKYVQEGRTTYQILLNWFDAGTHESRELAEEFVRQWSNTRNE